MGEVASSAVLDTAGVGGRARRHGGVMWTVRLR